MNRIFTLLLAWACFAGGALAAEFAPAPPSVRDMQRVGSGSLHWFGLKIYDAALYAPGGRADPAEAFALSLRYARALEGKAIAERSVQEIERLGMGSDAQRNAWLKVLRSLFPDVAEGDWLAGVHLPGRGARFYHNGRLIGAVNDAELAHAFFAIWLDPRTREPGLRSALLGRS